MRQIFFLAMGGMTLFALMALARAETADSHEALATAEKFIEALNKLDADAARELMEPSATIILSLRNEDGTPRHSIRNRDEYLATWDQLSGVTVEEKMWAPVIQSDGPIATIWMDYALYIDGAFRQCGKNGFNMIRQEDGWKIAGAVSSVRQLGCEDASR